MRFKNLMSGLLLGSFLAPVEAVVLEFHSFTGLSASVDGTLDGATVADQYGGHQYTSYVGSLGLMFADPSVVEDIIGTPLGSFRGDAGGAHAGGLGLMGFCIDSETGFGVSATTDQTFYYEPMSWEVAEARYLSEGVGGYRAGGLKKAAYLLERHYVEADAGGDLEAAAMQAAIWEVLTDSDPNLNDGRGNYFLRTDTGDATLNQRSGEIAALTSQWFAEADAADWGGSGYDPLDRVLFWLDPADTGANQSVITLNPNLVSAVPEPGVALLVVGGLGLALRRRRNAMGA